MSLDDFHDRLRRKQYREAIRLAEEAIVAGDSALCEEMALALDDEVARADHGRDPVDEEMLRTVVDLQVRARGADSEAVYVAWWSLGQLYERRGLVADARRAYEQMIAVAERLADEPALLERGLTLLAALLSEANEYARAEDLLRRALASLERTDPARARRERLAGKKGPDLSAVLGQLSLVLLQRGQIDEATRVFARRVSLVAADGRRANPDDAVEWARLAELYRLQKRYADAEPLLKRALQVRERAHGSAHLYVGWAAHDLGRLYVEMGKAELAVPLLRRALAILRRERGLEDERVREVEQALRVLCESID